MAELEEVTEGCRQNLADTLGDVRTEIREIRLSEE